MASCLGPVLEYCDSQFISHRYLSTCLYFTAGCCSIHLAGFCWSAVMVSNKKTILYRGTSWQAVELKNLCQPQQRTSGRYGKKGCGIYSIFVWQPMVICFFVSAKSSQEAQMAVNSSLCTSSCQSLWCSSQPGSHRVQGQTLKGT